MRGKRLAVKILVCLTLVLCVGGVLFCVGYRLRHPVNSYSNPQSQQQAREQVGITQQDYSNPSREQANNQENYAAKWFEPITLLTVFLVIGVGVTAYIYWRQLKEMQKTVAAVVGQGKTMEGQLGVMREQTAISRTSANAAELSAKAAEQSAQIASQSFAIGERPYLFVETPKLYPLVAGTPPSVKLRIRNGGRTPAFGFWADITFAVAPKQPNLEYAEAIDEQVTVFLRLGEK